MSVEAFELVKYFPLTKVDEANHTVYGLATCEKADKEGEISDYEGTKKSYQEWAREAQESTAAAGQGVSFGNIRYMHRLIIAGKATKIKFDDVRKQIWLESTPSPPLSSEDPDVWPLLRDGFLRGYSQGGKYISRVCDDCRKDIQGNFCTHCDKRVLVRYVPSIAEVSFVDNPCLKEATFTLVKSDGSTELKKFVSKEEITLKEGFAPKVSKAEKCPCKCSKCEGGKCSECTAETKCSSSKAVKYLVEEGGEKHLPYTKENGKPDHRLMGAAWAALHEGHRGNKYEGPNKAKALKRLKQVYAQLGLDTPAEKAEVIDALLKDMVETRIQSRAYGQLGKGMYTVSRFASICEDLKYLWLSLEYERETEGDESPVTDDLKETFENLLDHLLAYTEEQIEEEKEGSLAR